MTDAELQSWWPALGTVVAELRRIDRSAAADALVEALGAGATSGEVLAGIGAVLRQNRALRSELSADGAAAWKSVAADVRRAFPGSRLGHWLAGLTRR